MQKLVLFAVAAGLLTAGTAFSQGKAATPKADSKPVAVPDGSPQEILDFMEESLTLNPADDSPEAIRNAFEQAINTVIAAAEKVLAHPQANDEHKESAQQFRIDLLYQGAQAEIPGMSEKLQKLAESLQKAQPKSEMAALAGYRAILAVHEDEIGLDPEAIPQVEGFIETFPGEVAAVNLLEAIVQSSEWAVNPDAGKKACEILLKHFPEESKHLRIEGVKRRLESIGKPFVLSGARADGKPFDIKDLKGKVVLVDFWATWCGPCLAEFPELRKAYEKYRGRGFEIVGVSLDEDKESFDEFMTENKLPWLQLFEPAESNRGFDNPNAARYGITAIPAMFLLDREGRVVSTTVRGPFLETVLEDLLATPSANN